MWGKLLVLVLFGLLLWFIAEQAFRGEFTFGATIKEWFL